MTELLDELALCGADPAGGVTRSLYDPSWREAQRLLAERMEKSGLHVYYDDVGNLFGRLQGTDPTAGTLMTGSHIDTVKQGGRFDGAYGIAAGVVALEYLKERYGTPRQSIEIVSFCEEEGDRFPLAYWGSGNISGRYSLKAVPGITDTEGISLRQAMTAAGFGPGLHRPPRRTDIRSFIELHIEQGIRLEREGMQLGIVEGIVGQKRFTYTVEGESNHAGTTPMNLRCDALAGACRIISGIETAAREKGDPLVATVGRIEVSPGLSNVIAGKAVFSLDVRHADAGELDDFCLLVQEEAERIAASRGLSVRIEEWINVQPAPMHSRLSSLLEQLALGRGFGRRRMHSGAGHDAQLMQRICPTAMLFVPSRRGISHSPEEYTSPQDLAAGAAVLTDILHLLAYKGGSL
ncbi:M20 family metallo-hydrolase [Paenibacillus sp. P25]|nr:M20 family metallo-hydrolase [Paenibacillus sp. P25]